MIKKRNGFFSLTKKRVEFVRPETAGELYALLFQTLFPRLNLAYLAAMSDNPELQYMITVPLYLLRMSDDSWRPSEYIRDEWRSEPVALQSFDFEGFDDLFQTETRLVRPLAWFGLLEIKIIDEDFGHLRLHEVRKTALNHKSLNFDFPRSVPDFNLWDFDPGPFAH